MVSALLMFISAFLTALNVVIKSDLISAMITVLPNTVNKCRNLLGVKKNFQTYVCCKQCNTLYQRDKCLDKINGKLVSKRCTHIDFPNHPMPSFRRKKCGALLLKEVRIGSKYFHYPFRNFCYKSLTESLKLLLSREDFISKCEHWRDLQCSPQLLKDVYDGRIWKEFQTVDGRDFLKQKNSYGLMMNVDWFQPFKHTAYSVGAIYMVVMNLPRAERFRPENVILCGIIPGPAEHQFLSKLVSELLDLWSGVYVEIRLHVRIRAALMCVASDIPATRKVCGFIGHNSIKGCSKCLKSFSVRVGAPSNYGGYDRATWTSRTEEHHRHFSKKYTEADTKKERKKIESENGVRPAVIPSEARL